MEGTERFSVEKFSYNGFFVKLLGETAPYTVTFVKWANDPGVGVFDCSDGEQRYIPTIALNGDLSTLPEPTWKSADELGVPAIFGNPSSSE